VTLHDGKPGPKVIDFGIAKATNAELTEKTLFTEHRQMVGTPEYMSPEQAEMSTSRAGSTRWRRTWLTWSRS
jgi:serine/threonine protein kinase